MNAMMTTKPERETDDPVYSNFEHNLDEAVVSLLEADPYLCAQHAAWNFCGYVWRGEDGVWRNEVWRYHAPVELIEGETVSDVIQAACEGYGDG